MQPSQDQNGWLASSSMRIHWDSTTGSRRFRGATKTLGEPPGCAASNAIHPPSGDRRGFDTDRSPLAMRGVEDPFVASTTMNVFRRDPNVSTRMVVSSIH